MSVTDDETLKEVPAPWKCTGQVYSMFFYSSSTFTTDKKLTENLSEIAFSPLERESFFASAEAGQFSGGLGGFMIVRYTETPVGPYDELLIIPGKYTYHVEEKGKSVQKRHGRITRIYVSQKHTQFNGRYNWNIPKHLARFEWEDLPNGTKKVSVFPDDDVEEDIPLFQASFKTIPFVPAFPMSTAWAKYLGMDLSIVQPPLPQGTSREVAGTENWCKCLVTQTASRTHVGWFDLKQEKEKGEDLSLSGFENFWPGLKRWHLGIRMDDAIIEVPEGEYWSKSLL